MGLALACALTLTAGLAGCFEGQPRKHTSPAEQKALPVDEFFLGDSLCPANYVPDRLATRWRREGVREYRALQRALQRHPSDFVTARYMLSDPEPGQDRIQTEDLMVFQLAETHIRVISGPDDEADIAVEGSGPMQCRQRMRGNLIRLMGGPERAVSRTSGQIAHVP